MCKIREILGEKLANECEDELSDRIHPEDTPELRQTLIKGIILRYVQKRNLSLDALKEILPDEELCYVRRLENNVLNIIYDSMHKVNPKKG